MNPHDRRRREKWKQKRAAAVKSLHNKRRREVWKQRKRKKEEKAAAAQIEQKERQEVDAAGTIHPKEAGEVEEEERGAHEKNKEEWPPSLPALRDDEKGRAGNGGGNGAEDSIEDAREEEAGGSGHEPSSPEAAAEGGGECADASKTTVVADTYHKDFDNVSHCGEECSSASVPHEVNDEAREKGDDSGNDEGGDAGNSEAGGGGAGNGGGNGTEDRAEEDVMGEQASEDGARLSLPEATGHLAAQATQSDPVCRALPLPPPRTIMPEVVDVPRTAKRNDNSSCGCCGDGDAADEFDSGHLIPSRKVKEEEEEEEEWREEEEEEVEDEDVDDVTEFREEGGDINGDGDNEDELASRKVKEEEEEEPREEEREKVEDEDVDDASEFREEDFDSNGDGENEDELDSGPCIPSRKVKEEEEEEEPREEGGEKVEDDDVDYVTEFREEGGDSNCDGDGEEELDSGYRIPSCKVKEEEEEEPREEGGEEIEDEDMDNANEFREGDIGSNGDGDGDGDGDGERAKEDAKETDEGAKAATTTAAADAHCKENLSHREKECSTTFSPPKKNDAAREKGDDSGNDNGDGAGNREGGVTEDGTERKMAGHSNMAMDTNKHLDESRAMAVKSTFDTNMSEIKTAGHKPPSAGVLKMTMDLIKDLDREKNAAVTKKDTAEKERDEARAALKRAQMALKRAQANLQKKEDAFDRAASDHQNICLRNGRLEKVLQAEVGLTAELAINGGPSNNSNGSSRNGRSKRPRTEIVTIEDEDKEKEDGVTKAGGGGTPDRRSRRSNAAPAEIGEDAANSGAKKSEDIGTASAFIDESPAKKKQCRGVGRPRRDEKSPGKQQLAAHPWGPGSLFVGKEGGRQRR